jgi:hypothetical protein
MNRCPKFARALMGVTACVLLMGAAALFAADARAERDFPRKARLGEMTFVAIPDVVLNGIPQRMSHGARVYSVRNTILMPNRVNGSTAIVNYLRDDRGRVSQVWILTPAEAAAMPPNPELSGTQVIIGLPQQTPGQTPQATKPSVVITPAPAASAAN